MPANAHCPDCGSPLPDYWPKGLCPRCALGGALGESPATTPGKRSGAPFGDYELLEEVGRGGMGVIYRARQISLNRIVALKMILAGQFAGKQEVLRFRSEAEAAATLQHPNIVRIHETGERDGHHYFSMDYVEGRTLADIVRDGPLPAERAARYTRTISEAIHYAHTQGVLHRDLKSSNVIIDFDDQPRITDFGLAKRVHGDFGMTVTGQVLGSPNFMPPEQTSARSGKVGTASDVYGIGAVLYHLLTGRPPFHAETIEELLLLLRDTEPVPPRLLNPSVPRDLETICLKCLEKDAARRYPAAQELSEELGRFLRNEPIAARPIGTMGRFWRWCRRRPTVAALSSGVLLLLLVVALGSSLAVWRVDQARQGERAANQGLRHTVSLLELDRAEDFFIAHDSAAGVAHLAAILRLDPSNSLTAHRLMSALVHRRWAVPCTPPLHHEERVLMATFSPDGHHVLSASWDKTACIRAAATGERVVAVRHDGAVSLARFSPDGTRFLTASADGTARVWDATTGAALTPWLRHGDKVNSAEFSGDGRLVLTASADQTVRIWDPPEGEPMRELRGQGGALVVARFSPDASLVATASEEGEMCIWNASSGKTLFRLDTRSRIHALAFSPDGHRLVSAHDDGGVRLWATATGTAIGEPIHHRSAVWLTVFSPDGKRLLTTSEDGTARLWDARTLRVHGEPMRHESGVIFGDFSRDGRSVVTTSTDNTARVWDAQTGNPLCQPLRHAKRVPHAAFSPDGRRIATASYDTTIQVWELREPLEPGVQMPHERDVAPLAFSSDGAALLTAAGDRTARLWNPRTGQPLSDPMIHDDRVTSGDLSPDGGRAAVGSLDGTVRLWEFGAWRGSNSRVSPRLAATPFGHSNRVLSLRFSADGERLATASADGTARVWEARNGQPITPPMIHTGAVVSAQFSRDHRHVITASEDYSARVWDAQSGRPITEPLMHLDHVKWAEFSPDGEWVVTASTDTTACIWNVRTGRKQITLHHRRIVNRAVYSPDGRRIATASIDRTARIWDATTGQALTPPLQHDSFVECVYFDSRGEHLVTVCRSGLARFWDVNTGRPLTEWLNAGSFWSACFDPVEERIAVGVREGVLQLWEIPRAPTPVPEWFPTFAEAAAGVRLAERGAMELVPVQNLRESAAHVHSGASTNVYERLIRGFAH